MACASAHHKEVEDLMASEVLVTVVEDRELQRVDHAADGVDVAPGKEPSELGGRQVIQNLAECKHAYPAHADVEHRRHPFRTVDPEAFDDDSGDRDAPYKSEKGKTGPAVQHQKAHRGVASCDQYEDHHVVDLLQQCVQLLR